MLAYTGLTDDFMHVWPPAVLTAIEAGDLDAASGLLAHVDDAPVGLRTPVLEAYLHLLRGLLAAARGLDDEAEPDLRRAVDLFAAYGSPPLHGKAEESFGRWLRAQGRDEAETHLAAARSIFESLGAEGWLDRLDDGLTAVRSRDLGRSPRRYVDRHGRRLLSVRRRARPWGTVLPGVRAVGCGARLPQLRRGSTHRPVLHSMWHRDRGCSAG